MKKLLLAIVLLLTPTVRLNAAISFVSNVRGQKTGNTFNPTTGLTTTNGDLVVSSVINLIDARFLSMGDTKSNTYTLVNQQTYGTTVGIRQFYNGNITGGAPATVFMTTASLNDDTTIFASEFTGFTGGAVLDQTSKAAQTGTQTPSSGATPTRATANELLAGTFGAAEVNLASITAGSGFTLSTPNGTVLNGAVSPAGAIEFEVVSATGTDACTFTFSGTATNTGTICGTYKSVGGGSTVVPGGMMRTGFGP